MLKFGTQTEFTVEDGHLVRTQEKFFDLNRVVRITDRTEQVKVKNEKQALAEFLRLLDMYRAGECTDFSINCITTRTGELMRVDKTWRTEDLQ